jgi:hypothetical protein
VRRQTALLLAAMISAISLCLAMPALARPRPGVDLGIHITAPPSLAVVPGLPVYYAPTLPYNYFFDGTTYYVFLRNHWYAAPTYNGPWGMISVSRVPAPILAVPVQYYKVPPPAPPAPAVPLGINLPAPPALAVVPGFPVYYAPTLPYNYFMYANVYYVFLNNQWYYAPTYNGPWVRIAVAQVPPPILAVPVEYYRAPPAHWTRPGPPPWAEGGRGYGHWHEREERHR